MPKSFAATRFELGLATWAEEATNPNAGAGTPAAVGSWWQQQGAYPAVPTTLQLKVGAGDKGWLKQNLVNVNVFNVKDPAYGAVGDGVTDDTAAIQAATDACNAAGGGVVYFPPVDVNNGQFYRLKRTANIGSIQLSNYRNITFRGDGFASKVAMFDDSGAVNWKAFNLTNGTSRCTFENFQISGEGITNPPGNLNDLISIFGASTDANVGTGFVDVIGMFWGPIPRLAGVSTGSHLVAFGDDAAHIVKNVRYLYCLGGYSFCNRVAAFGAAAGFVTKCGAFYSWVGGFDNVGITSSTDATQVDHQFDAIGNLVDAQSVALALSTIRSGNTQWNIVTNGGGVDAAGGSALVRRVNVRGNVFTKTNLTSNNPMVSLSSTNAYAEVVGNIVANLADIAGVGVFHSSGAETSSCNACDNIVATVFSGSPLSIQSQNGVRFVASGNIALCTANGAGSGTGIRFQDTNLAFVEAPIVVGNLIIASGANDLNSGVDCQVTNAQDMHAASICYNFTLHAQRGTQFLRGTGNFLNWRACNSNNVVAATVGTVTLPSTNVGVTHEGPAGPGAQIALNSTTPVANVSAPTGSLCANTGGGAGTALSYKESGAGVSGGSAGWFGLGGAELVFGALAGSLATANRFFAPGGLGLAAESTTEIQAAATRAGQLRNLRSRMVAGTGGGTNTYTVRKNGVDTTVTIAVANTATSGSDTTHAAAVVKGDLVSVRVSKGVAPTTAQTNIVLGLEIV